MSLTHEQADQLLAGFALGGLSEGESKLVRRHLETCEACAASLAAMAEVVGELPLSVDLVQPSPALRERVLAIPARRGRLLPVLPRPARPGRLRGLLVPPPRLTWGAVAVMAFALVTWNVALQRQLNDTNARVSQLNHQTLHGTLSGAGTGSASYLARDQVALVVLRGMATPPAEDEYELWVIPAGGKPVPAAAFVPESDGTKMLVLVRAMTGTETLAVTAEPRGKPHLSPTSTPFLSGRMT